MVDLGGFNTKSELRSGRVEAPASKHSSLALSWRAAEDSSPLTAARSQGLTLLHFSAQRKHFLWDTLGTFSR